MDTVPEARADDADAHPAEQESSGMAPGMDTVPEARADDADAHPAEAAMDDAMPASGSVAGGEGRVG